MAELPDNRDERLLHRLEAFSDIVIGFSLAQVGLSLVVPEKIGALWHKPVPFVAFVITFALICSIWYAHNRLFAHFFVPTPLNVVLNFVTLGSVIMLVYSVQLFVHFPGEHSVTTFYAGCLAVAFGLIATLYAIGLRQRRAYLETDMVRSGFKRVARMGGISVGLILFLISSPLLSREAYQVAMSSSIIFGVLSSRAVLALLRRRGIMP